MAYMFYLDKMLLPITPSNVQINIENQNETINLINDSEVNILKQAGLTSIDFDILLPNIRYPFAVYKDGFQRSNVYLDEIKRLKISQRPFQFIIIRELGDGIPLFNTNIKVSIEDYKIKEDAKQGFDVIVSVSLKQYRDYGTKICNIAFPDNGKRAVQNTQNARASNTQQIGIGSDVIVNGSLYRDSYGNGVGKTLTNYRGKVNLINVKGSHPYHITTPEGGWLGWVTTSSIQGV